MAERGGHAPLPPIRRDDLISNESRRLGRFAFHGPHGRICTRNLSVLSGAPLLVGPHGEKNDGSRRSRAPSLERDLPFSRRGPALAEFSFRMKWGAQSVLPRPGLGHSEGCRYYTMGSIRNGPPGRNCTFTAGFEARHADLLHHGRVVSPVGLTPTTFAFAERRAISCATGMKNLMPDDVIYHRPWIKNRVIIREQPKPIPG